jgi:hypothetical protein
MCSHVLGVVGCSTCNLVLLPGSQFWQGEEKGWRLHVLHIWGVMHVAKQNLMLNFAQYVYCIQYYYM